MERAQGVQKKGTGNRMVMWGSRGAWSNFGEVTSQTGIRALDASLYFSGCH